MGNRKSQPFRTYLILTPTEERVVRFLASQKHGASVSGISQALNLARTSIYRAVDSLAQKKTITREGFIYALINKRWRLYNPEDAEAKRQINKLLQEILCLRRGEILYSIESEEEIKELFEKKAGLLAWQRAVAEKGIVLKGIGTKRALSVIQSLSNQAIKETLKKRSGSARFTETHFAGSCTLVSFRNSVIFFSRTKNFFYRIDDAHVAKFTQSIVDLLYNFLEYHPIIPE